MTIVKVWKLGRMSFDTAYKIQTVLARRHIEGLTTVSKESFNTLLLVEHKPVYTVGIRDHTPDEEILHLIQTGADFRKTNRGGLITFHGPGQLVAYPVINLKQFNAGVRCYVDMLEEIVIRLCGEMGIEAKRSPHTGVWIDDEKIAAIGIHASRYITTHGIALNCNIDLDWFQHIVPCGIPNKGVTTLSKQLENEIDVNSVHKTFLKHFRDVFSCETQEISLDDKEKVLNITVKEILAS